MSIVPETSLPGELILDDPSSMELGLIPRERWALRELLRLVSERAESERKTEAAWTSGNASVDEEYQRARLAMMSRLDSLEAAATKLDEERRRAVIDAAISGEAQAKSEFGKASRRIATEFESIRERAGSIYQKERSDAASNFEAGERDASKNFAKAIHPIQQALDLSNAYRERLDILFQDYKKFGLADPPTTPTRETYTFDDPADVLSDRLIAVDKPLSLLEGLIFPKMMKGKRFLWLFVILFILLVIPAFLLNLALTSALGAAFCGAIALGLGLKTWLDKLSKSQVSQRYYPVFQSIIDAEALAAHCRNIAETRQKEQKTAAAKRRDDELQQAKSKHSKTVSTGEQVRDERLREINETYARKMMEIQTKQQLDLREAIEAHSKRKAEVREQAVSSPRKLEEKYQALKEKIRTRHDTTWNNLAQRWRTGIAKVSAVLEDVTRETEACGPRWDDPASTDRPAPSTLPSVARFGEIRVELAKLPGGISNDSRLMQDIPLTFTFPVVRPFPSVANLVIEAPAAGRSAAVALLQAAMLRLLTSLPPGAVRFTIIDPIGIGRNFGAFMHMADYDESLVNGQVWTDPRQIDERLAELAMHMEKVNQKYLRNEYASIEEYNAAAGEVAEPYRVVVIADFPSGFDEKSATRLASIASSGVPCGVLTLVALDQDKPFPSGITMQDLDAGAVHLAWNGNTLAWDDPDFGKFPLVLDTMPPGDLTTKLIQRSAAAARDARRVEVPFDYIAPAPSEFWKRDSRAGIDVPLGKAAATKRQHMMLGKGTSQHVLIAGRTGSGKSTLLHALITNLALNYSPDEVELYLIDFKKGVEFKVYANNHLPHAGIIAIESEREFGISVLQRLDAEMRLRADWFRDASVQDLNGYRNAPGTPPLPRILLIVDEFQEFFVEEDKLAQEAALLLDRLVRQGRAFGVHIILGSQTLGGAFTLARTTLGQMAVRVALQCSETDAHLILSEQNTAATLLSRPGEAVYNDANGMAEGNHFFQVVWLPDERREAYLKRITELARERPPILRRTAIVFEGDAPAEVSRNPKLTSLLESPEWPATPRSSPAWLGDPVAIKEPTSALFRRQGGNHLLIVGQNGEAALGIITSAILSLAAQYPPSTSDTVRSGAKIAILDGTPEDDPHADFLSRLARMIPHVFEFGSLRDAGRILGTVAAEVEGRGQPSAPDGPEIFVFIHDLPRFRDLRKKEDDFSFSRKEEEASPADHLRSVVREGAGVGVHIITWCDNLNNLQRVFDNQALREFEMRVLFQMSPNDSGHLLDAPHASKLGANRALFASEEQNRLEKFRPYGIPDEAWLAEVGLQFKNRAIMAEKQESS